MFSLVFLLTLTATSALRTTSIVDRSSQAPKVKSEFKEVGNQHYFRKTGRMIGAASFAHIAYEIDLNLLEEEINTVCRCSKLRLEDFFRMKHAQKDMEDPSFWTNYRQRWRALGGNKVTLDIMAQVCGDLRAELNEIRRSFDPIHEGGDARKPRNNGIFNQDWKFEGRHHHSGTETASPHRQQRFAVSGTILLLSGIASIFTGWQLKKLWDGTHEEGGIVERLEEQEVLTNDLKKAIDTTATDDLVKHLKHKEELDVYVISMMKCNQEVNRFKDHFKRIFQAIYELLNQRLHPGIVKSKTLQAKLDLIRKKAAARHQRIANVNELYQLDTSYVSSGDGKIVVFAHIPLFKLSTVTDLYEYIPTPSISKFNLTSSRGDVYRIDADKMFLARSSEGYSTEISATELDQCIKIGRNYICKHQNVLHRHNVPTCLTALFEGQSEVIDKVCEIKLLTKSAPSVTQIDDHRFLTYLPKQERIEITCEAYQHNQQLTKRLSGMYLVTVPEGCVCKAGGFRFISIGNLGMFRSAVQVENTFDIRETLQIIGNQEMSQIFNDFDKEEKRVVKLENILSTFEHRKHWTKRNPEHITYSLGTIAILAGLAILLALWAGWRPCKKTKRAQIDEERNVVYRPTTQVIEVEKPKSIIRTPKLRRAFSKHSVDADDFEL